MPKVLISYRREDTAYLAATLHKELAERLGGENVFMDVDTIPPGRDFRKHLQLAVARCDVVLAVIDDRWVDARAADGRRRLDLPTDWVRIELETALRRGIPVIPLLVGSANVPAEADLPEPLRELVYRQAFRVRSGRDLYHDVDVLWRELERTSTIEEEDRRREVGEAERRRQAEAERQHVEAEAAAARQAEEEERKRQAEEAERRRQAEAERQHVEAEAAAARQAEEEERKRQAEQAERRRQAEAERQRVKAEAAAARHAGPEGQYRKRLWAAAALLAGSALLIFLVVRGPNTVAPKPASENEFTTLSQKPPAPENEVTTVAPEPASENQVTTLSQKPPAPENEVTTVAPEPASEKEVTTLSQNPPAPENAPSLLPAPAPTPTTMPATPPTAVQPAVTPPTEPPPPVTKTMPAPEPPRILSQRPAAGRPIVVMEGDSVGFGIQASGRGLRYRWLLDGEEVGIGASWRFVAPAASVARTPFHVEVQVTGTDGAAERPGVWSGEVTWKPPELRRPVPADARIRVPAGEDRPFRIQASAPRGAGDVRYEWSVDGKPALRGSEPEFTLGTQHPGTHWVEVAAVDGRGAWSTHRWTVEVVAPSPRTVPPVAVVPPTTVAPPPMMAPTTVRPYAPTTLSPAPPTTLPGARARADAGVPITDEEMAAWVNRLRSAYATKDLAALRALGVISPDEEKPFRKKIANNSDYSVVLWNVSIMIDPRGADVTFDRRDSDDGKVTQQPPRTVRLVRGPGGLVVVP
jgi:hypothetical protein